MEFSHFFSKIPIECDFAYYSSILGLVAIDQKFLSFCEDSCLIIPFHCADKGNWSLRNTFRPFQVKS